MDDKLILAMVAGGAALLGSLIPTVVGYMNNRNQRKFEMKKALGDKQSQIYSDLMVSLQKMVNTQSNDNFLELQQAVIQVSIYGDDSTSVALNEYYSAIVKSSQPGGTALVKEQHQSHQQKILNGMRANLKLRPLSEFEIISFRPPQA
jgi:hypothetical protein